MNIQGSFNKLEATFWDSIIRLMSSSPMVQHMIKRGFELIKDKEIVWLAGIILAWTAAGLTVGYFLGFQGLR